jgi:hypothetical protein
MTPRQQDGILWLWQTTELSATQIGKRLGLTKSQVLGHVYRKRQEGDVRAVSRAPKRKAQTLETRIAELERLVATMRREQRQAA